MKKLYLVTGATGHVGTVLVAELLRRKADVRILVLPRERKYAPDGVAVCEGDVTVRESLLPFFERGNYDHVTLIHCAALISIASKYDPAVWDTNVEGTRNIMDLALESKADRIVYVSSVHAIPERPEGEVITEVRSFSPDLVHGQYAKSKAAAAQIVLDHAMKGLNVSIVHPSGIIGPGDLRQRNHMIRTIRAMADGTIPVALKGGYDFVDSRDVVSGILGCEEKGVAGECYILNGHYITVKDILNTIRKIQGKRQTNFELPYGLSRALSPISEKICGILGIELPIFTPYSIYTLHTNGLFSHEKAYAAFGYAPMAIEQSIRDSL